MGNARRTCPESIQDVCDFLISSMMVYKRCWNSSCAYDSINGERGMTRCRSTHYDIHLGSGTLWVWQGPGRGFRGQGAPPDAARVEQPTFSTPKHVGF